VIDLETSLARLAVGLALAGGLSASSGAVAQAFRILPGAPVVPPGESVPLLILGSAPCPVLFPPVVEGNRIVVMGSLREPLPCSFETVRLLTALPGLPSGTYTIEVRFADDGPAFASRELVVRERELELALEAGTQTSNDRVVATVSGFGECPFVESIDVQATRVVIDIATGCPFDPPFPPQDFSLPIDLGKLPAGDYEVVLRKVRGEVEGGGLLAISGPPPPALAVEPPAPISGQPFRVVASIPRPVRCEPVLAVQRDGSALEVEIEPGCLGPSVVEGDPTRWSLPVNLPGLPAGNYSVRLFDRFGNVYVQSDFAVQPPGDCAPAATTLCLQGGRFAVRARWTTADGSSGDALANPRTADAGGFTFFDPANVELLVKVLDACALDPGRYWVFLAGLTNVGVRVEVTDTLRDTTRVYENPQGRLFEPTFDIDAFRSCP
jgi:hypothetical protein